MKIVGIFALLLATGPADFRELECSAVPGYANGKRVVLRVGQLRQSAVDADTFGLVEFEGMVGLLHYEVRRVGRNVLKGTATRVSTSDWKHQSSPVICKILK